MAANRHQHDHNHYPSCLDSSSMSAPPPQSSYPAHSQPELQQQHYYPTTTTAGDDNFLPPTTLDHNPSLSLAPSSNPDPIQTFTPDADQPHLQREHPTSQGSQIHRMNTVLSAVTSATSRFTVSPPSSLQSPTYPVNTTLNPDPNTNAVISDFSFDGNPIPGARAEAEHNPVAGASPQPEAGVPGLQLPPPGIGSGNEGGGEAEGVGTYASGYSFNTTGSGEGSGSGYSPISGIQYAYGYPYGFGSEFGSGGQGGTIASSSGNGNETGIGTNEILAIVGAARQDLGATQGQGGEGSESRDQGHQQGGKRDTWPAPLNIPISKESAPVPVTTTATSSLPSISPPLPSLTSMTTAAGIPTITTSPPPTQPYPWPWTSHPWVRPLAPNLWQTAPHPRDIPFPVSAQWRGSREMQELERARARALEREREESQEREGEGREQQVSDESEEGEDGEGMKIMGLGNESGEVTIETAVKKVIGRGKGPSRAEGEPGSGAWLGPVTAATTTTTTRASEPVTSISADPAPTTRRSEERNQPQQPFMHYEDLSYPGFVPNSPTSDDSMLPARTEDAAHQERPLPPLPSATARAETAASASVPHSISIIQMPGPENETPSRETVFRSSRERQTPPLPPVPPGNISNQNNDSLPEPRREKQPRAKRVLLQSPSSSSNSRPPGNLWTYTHPFLPELLSLILSIVCLASICALLKRYDNHSLRDWPLQVSLNTVVAFLTAICQVGLWRALSEGLAQLKWNMLARGGAVNTMNKTLGDWEVIEDARRGVAGCVRVLVGRKGRCVF